MSDPVKLVTELKTYTGTLSGNTDQVLVVHNNNETVRVPFDQFKNSQTIPSVPTSPADPGNVGDISVTEDAVYTYVNGEWGKTPRSTDWSVEYLRIDPGNVTVTQEQKDAMRSRLPLAEENTPGIVPLAIDSTKSYSTSYAASPAYVISYIKSLINPENVVIGLSTYDIAVENGFRGTEAEWLASLKAEYASEAVAAVTPLVQTAQDEANRATVAANKAAQHEDVVRGLLIDATAHESNAKAYAEQAKDSSDNADAALYEAKQAMQEANSSAANASEKAANATQKATEAANSATAATAAQTAAEQAKQDAQAAQTKAEQEAVKAEQNAALLGDAALQSGDNVFSGSNAFAGEVVGVLPGDFLKFAWLDDAELIADFVPDLLSRRSWYYYTPKLPLKSYMIHGDYKYNVSAFEDIVFYSEYVGNSGELYSFLGTNGVDMRRFALVLPNYKGGMWPVSNNLYGTDFCIENCEIYAPEVHSVAGFRRARIINLKIVAAITELKDSAFEIGSSASTLLRISFPKNSLKTLILSQMKVLREVLSSFPYATIINLQMAKLDKASVLRIVSGLQPYDAAAMSAVPELTLGIDPALDGDEEINAALLNAQESVENGGKGWNVAVDGFTITAGSGAATMGLRRLVYVKREMDAEGGYIAADGQRWAVRWGNTVLENWVANEQLGYEAFPSVEVALAEWGLTEYVPEPEETLTNE